MLIRIHFARSRRAKTLMARITALILRFCALDAGRFVLKQ
jgi:hypothetical protein